MAFVDYVPPAAAALVRVKSVNVWEDIDTLNIANYTITQKVALDSFQHWPVNRVSKMFRDNKPLCAQQNAKWADAQTQILGPTTGLPQAAVGIQVMANRDAATLVNAIVGWFHVTYYVTFRG